MNTWTDMQDDLDFDTQASPTVVTEAIASQRFAAPKAEYVERCGKCGGTGRYRAPSSFGNNCFACGGSGHKVFKTSPEQRLRARATAIERKARARKSNAQAFAEANPKIQAWLVAKAPGFDLAANMLEAVAQFGDLTDGQRTAVERMMAKDEERAAALATRVEDPRAAGLRVVVGKLSPRSQEFANSLLEGYARYGSFSERQAPYIERLIAEASKPVERFDALHSVLQRHAKFYAGDLTISRKNADQLCWIKHANSEKVIGKLDNGVLTLWHRPGVDQAEVRSMLEEFEGAPLQTAMKYGKLAGRCCSCGRELTNDGSIEAGIGPVCATKFA